MKIVTDDGQEFQIKRIETVSVAPGEKLVAFIPFGSADMETIERIQDVLSAFFVDIPCMVIPDNVTLKSVKKDG